MCVFSFLWHTEINYDIEIELTEETVNKNNNSNNTENRQNNSIQVSKCTNEQIHRATSKVFEKIHEHIQNFDTDNDGNAPV